MHMINIRIMNTNSNARPNSSLKKIVVAPINPPYAKTRNKSVNFLVSLW